MTCERVRTHDLLARCAAPAAGSKWAADLRQYADVKDPRRFIDDVLPDEIPLWIEHELEPVLTRPRRAEAPAA